MSASAQSILRFLVASAFAAAAMTGCGGDESPSAGARQTSLSITVDRDGPSGAAQPRVGRVSCTAGRPRACERLDQLRPSQLAPVPRDRSCTMIFGGPQTATVHGVLRGARIDARLNRRNGCEIARWDAAAPVLALVR